MFSRLLHKSDMIRIRKVRAVKVRTNHAYALEIGSVQRYAWHIDF